MKSNENYLCIWFTLKNAQRHSIEWLETIMRWKFYGNIYYPMRSMLVWVRWRRAVNFWLAASPKMSTKEFVNRPRTGWAKHKNKSTKILDTINSILSSLNSFFSVIFKSQSFNVSVKLNKSITRFSTDSSSYFLFFFVPHSLFLGIRIKRIEFLLSFNTLEWYSEFSFLSRYARREKEEEEEEEW